MAKKNRITGEEALRNAYHAVDHQPLLDAWGVTLSDEKLRHTLTHRSFANENGGLPNYERLEFLGDAVLGVVVAEQLYNQFPERPESELSKMRASVVNGKALASLARELNNGPYLLLGVGETQQNGADKDSILADSVEAILGALYLEHGFAYAREVILRLFKDRITNAVSTGITMDWKTTLQEKLASKKFLAPEYITEVTGPAHDQSFSTQLFIDGQLISTGTGHNKKQSEHQAAQHAVEKLSS